MNNLNDLFFVPLISDLDMIKKHVNLLLKDKQCLLFEHNFLHVIAGLLFSNDLYLITYPTWSAIAAVDNDKKVIQILYPKFTDSGIFISDLLSLRQKLTKESTLKILYLNECDVACLQSFIINNQYLSLKPRSKNEAIYSVDILNELKGQHFSNLRNLKNKIAKDKDWKFVSVNERNISSVFDLQSKWQESQGLKYKNKKGDRERFLYKTIIQKFRNDTNCYFELCLYKDVPVGLFVLWRIDDEWAVLYHSKGLNQNIQGGVKGASNALYLRVFDIAYKLGLKFINDGELGEPGSASHKIGFLPIYFIKSFDLEIHSKI